MCVLEWSFKEVYEDFKLMCWRHSKQCSKAVIQMDRHACKCVVYLAKVNWKGRPIVQPSLQAESVRQMYKKLGSGCGLLTGASKKCGTRKVLQSFCEGFSRLKALKCFVHLPAASHAASVDSAATFCSGLTAERSSCY